MNEIEKLQYISLCSKVVGDIHSHIGIKDKVLTEYVIDQAVEARDEDEFINKMNEDGSGFSLQFCMSLFDAVHRMMPASVVRKKKQDMMKEEHTLGVEAQVAGGRGRIFGSAENVPHDLSKEELATRFPALALANNDEEIELQLDDIAGDSKPGATAGLHIDELKENRVKRKKSLSSDSGRSESPKKVRSKKRKQKQPSRSHSASRSASRNHNRSSSRSDSRDRSRSRSKKTKHTKNRSASESQEREKKRKEKKKERHRDEKGSKRYRDSSETPDVSRVYSGYVTMKLRDGVLVQLSDWKV